MDRRDFLKIGAAAAVLPTLPLLSTAGKPKDVLTWTTRENQEIKRITWSGSSFVAAADHYIVTSLDGSTWTAKAVGA
jgi:hypothetical protein